MPKLIRLFPAGAGMNRRGGAKTDLHSAVPRRRGDEPTRNGNVTEWVRCSPQARG